MTDHGHSKKEIAARIATPPGRGFLRDAVFGAIDGTVTTFAIVAGVAGAGLSPFVIVALGLANVLADGFSMAAANYSGSKAEVENIRRIRSIEERHIREYPDGEKLEVREILSRKGLEGDVLLQATELVTRDRENWIALMLEGEYGLSEADPHPIKSAAATFAAFLLAGVVPLFPFLFGLESAFAISATLTMATFCVIGALKSIWSLTPWWRSVIETLAIGGGAAAIAYFVGSLFHAS